MAKAQPLLMWSITLYFFALGLFMVMKAFVRYRFFYPLPHYREDIELDSDVTLSFGELLGFGDQFIDDIGRMGLAVLSGAVLLLGQAIWAGISRRAAAPKP